MQTASTTSDATLATERPRSASERTCVGCGERSAPHAMLRLILAETADPKDLGVVVDAAAGGFGRGAHIHPRVACVQRAERGLSRTFKRAVRAPGAELALAIEHALARRIEGLLATAQRLYKLEIGADAVKARCVSEREQGKLRSQLLVSCDAGSIKDSHEVQDAIRAGRAVAYSTRAELGALLGRGEVAVLAITEDRLGSAIAEAVSTTSVLSPLAREAAGRPHTRSADAHLPEQSPAQPTGAACKCPEVQ